MTKIIGVDSTEKPLLSVVIPVYNVEKYLRECLDSVIHQSYSDLQIIIIDDGSTDSSGSICEEYQDKDSRIRVIHQSNHGLGNARNIGLKEATGKYIIFLDSDDYWKFNTTEELVKEAEKNDLQAVVFAAQPFRDGIKECRVSSYSLTCQNGLIKNGFESLKYAIHYGEYYPQACLRLYRLDYIKQHDLWFDEDIVHEDESFSFLAYLEAERIECIGERYYMRRYRPGSIMMSLDPVQSAHGYRVAADSIMKYMMRNHLNAEKQALCNRQIVNYILIVYSLYEKVTDQERQQIYKDTRKTIKLSKHELHGLPFRYRILIYDFHFGYYLWYIRTKGLRKVMPARVWQLIRDRRIWQYRMDMLMHPQEMHVACPCCGLGFREFTTGSYLQHPERYNPDRYKLRQDVLCPFCGALPRHRIFASWCKEHRELLKTKDILYFAPEPGMMRWMSRKRIRCVTADMYHPADLRINIEHTGLPAESYDLIVANHVLEHVDDFRMALKEVYRILRTNGIFICSFPMDPNVETVDEEETKTDEERLKRYGQVDHKRVFGMKADCLLEEAGFVVERIDGKDYPDEILPIVGPADYDANILFCCRKA